MEIWGISVDGEKVCCSAKNGRENKTCSPKIHKATGETFNINSSQQLGGNNFRQARNKTGQKQNSDEGSTSEEVLLSLKDAHPIIPEILEYRETFKINSTYAEPLLQAKEKMGE